MIYITGNFYFDGVSSENLGIKIVHIGNEPDTMPVFGKQSVIEQEVANSDFPVFIKTKKENLRFDMVFSLVEKSLTPNKIYELGKIFAKSVPVEFKIESDLSKVINVVPTSSIEMTRFARDKGYFKISFQATTPYWLTPMETIKFELSKDDVFVIDNKRNVQDRFGRYDVMPYLKVKVFPVVDFSFKINGSSVTIPYLSGEDLNFTIDWGDGTESVVNSTTTSQRTHTYSSSQEWTITIKDYVSGWINAPTNVTEVLTPFPASDTRTNFMLCFHSCRNLTNIPENLFANNPNVASFTSCFNNCNSLINIPENLFTNNPLVTDFYWCFQYCDKLTSIPENLFANNPLVADFKYCFYNCRNLTSIPKKLFVNNPNVTKFDSCFEACTSLTSVPENLFANNPNVEYFFRCFSSCTNLTSIPENLFDNNLDVIMFSGCFNNCDNLTSIPENLFANNPNVIDFSGCFSGCRGLTSIPENLFASNPNVEYFNQCFIHCNNLSNINIKIHSDVLARDTNYSYMFNVGSNTYSNQGLAPELWLSATTTQSHKSGCFENNTALTNYSYIPDEWK